MQLVPPPHTRNGRGRGHLTHFNNQLACLNHAVNFILYCIAGRRFRAELAALFVRGQRSTTLQPAPVGLSQLPTELQSRQVTSNKCIAVRKVATPLRELTRITQCYLPPGRGDIPALTPAEAGTRLSDPGGMQG